jgi:hypothetical protein
MSHDDERQERNDFQPTIKRDDPDRVEPDRGETNPDEHSVDVGDGWDPRVEQPGE